MVLGDRVTVKCGVSLYDGIVLEDDVFVGPGRHVLQRPAPPQRQAPRRATRGPSCETGASLGAGAILLPGVHGRPLRDGRRGLARDARRSGLRPRLRQPGARPRPRLPLRNQPRASTERSADCSCGRRYRARRGGRGERGGMSAGAAAHRSAGRVRRSRGRLPRASARRSTPRSRACSSRGRFILGEEVARFEEEFAAFLGVAHVVGCANGTEAIALALLAAGVTARGRGPAARQHLRPDARRRAAGGRQAAPVRRGCGRP